MRLSVAERRRLSIEAALRVISTEGIENATTRRIADEAGIPQSGLFYAFTNRDELLAAVIEFGIEQELNALTDRLQTLEAGSVDTALTAEQVLRATLEAFAGDVAGNAGREHTLISIGLFARRTAGLEDLATHLYRSYTNVVTQMLRRGAEIGHFTWTTNESEIATVVMALTDGLTLGYVMTGDDAAMARTVDAAVRVLQTYIEP